MKPKLTVVSLLILVTSIIAIPLWLMAQPGGQGGNPPKPPQEAIDACSGKSEGAACEFTSPRGDSLSGTCVKKDDQLACRPKGDPNGGSEGKPPTPPKEAIEACSGKTEGAACEFTSPRGDSVSGTCAKKDDQLACKPKNRPSGE